MLSAVINYACNRKPENIKTFSNVHASKPIKQVAAATVHRPTKNNTASLPDTALAKAFNRKHSLAAPQTKKTTGSLSTSVTRVQKKRNPVSPKVTATAKPLQKGGNIIPHPASDTYPKPAAGPRQKTGGGQLKAPAMPKAAAKLTKRATQNQPLTLADKPKAEIENGSAGLPKKNMPAGFKGGLVGSYTKSTKRAGKVADLQARALKKSVPPSNPRPITNPVERTIGAAQFTPSDSIANRRAVLPVVTPQNDTRKLNAVGAGQIASKSKNSHWWQNPPPPALANAVVADAPANEKPVQQLNGEKGATKIVIVGALGNKVTSESMAACKDKMPPRENAVDLPAQVLKKSAPPSSTRPVTDQLEPTLGLAKVSFADSTANQGTRTPLETAQHDTSKVNATGAGQIESQVKNNDGQQSPLRAPLPQQALGNVVAANAPANKNPAQQWQGAKDSANTIIQPPKGTDIACDSLAEVQGGKQAVPTPNATEKKLIVPKLPGGQDLPAVIKEPPPALDEALTPFDSLVVRNIADTEQVKPTQTFLHRVTLQNKSASTVRFTIEAPPDRRFKPFAKNAMVYSLSPGDSLVTGVKYLNAGARVNGAYQAVLNIVNAGTIHAVKPAHFIVQVVDGTNQQIMAHALNNEVVLQQSSKHFTIPVSFKNNLGDSKRVFLELQRSNRLPVAITKTKTKWVNLPGQDTVINLDFTVLPGVDGLKSYDGVVAVTIDDEAGKQAAAFSFSIRWLFSKGFITKKGAPPPTQRVLTVGTMLSTGGQYIGYALTAASTLPANANGVGFNVAYQPGVTKNGTFFSGGLQWRHGPFFMQLGNTQLTDFGLPVAGFGVYFKAGEANANKIVEAWAISRQNVLSALSTSVGIRNEGAAVKITLRGAGLLNEFAYGSSYFNRFDDNTRGQLHFASFKRKISTNSSFSVLLGTSIAKLRRPGHADSSLNGAEAKFGYNNQRKKWQQGLEVTLGSANFAGNVQGRTGIVGFVNFLATKKTALNLNINKNISEIPVYNDTLQHSNNFTANLLAQLRLNNQNKALPFALATYLFNQQLLNAGTPVNMSSVHAAIEISKTWPRFGFTAVADAGSYHYSLVPGVFNKTIALKISLGVFFNKFHLDVIDQNGPYYIYDLLNQLGVKDKLPLHTQHASFTYKVNLLNNLKFATGVNFYRNPSGIVNLGVNEHAELNVGNGWMINFLGSFLKSGTAMANNQFQLQVQKQFNWQQANPGTVNLSLTVFEDNNNDGIKQPTEKNVAQLPLTLDNLGLITDGRGTVFIKNLAKGLHTVKINYGDARQQNFIEKRVTTLKNSSQQLGIPPQFAVTGKLDIALSKFDLTHIDLEGVRLAFIDDAGNQFSTFTGADGVFTLKLPAANYRCFLPDRKTAGNAAVANFTVDAVTGYAQLLQIRVTGAGGRQVEIKTFNQRH